MVVAGLVGGEGIKAPAAGGARRLEHIYLQADLSIKQHALDRTTPLGTTTGRYQPTDHLPAFLDNL